MKYKFYKLFLGASIVFALLTFKIRCFTTSKKADYIFEVLDILPLFGGVGSFDKSESFRGEEGV